MLIFAPLCELLKIESRAREIRDLAVSSIQFDTVLEIAADKGFERTGGDKSMVDEEASADEKVKGSRCICASRTLRRYRCSLFHGSARRCGSNIHESLLTTINILPAVRNRISLVGVARQPRLK